MLVPVLAVAVAVAVGDTAVVVEITVVVAASVEDVGGGVVTAVDVVGVDVVVVESGATQGRQSATSWLAWSPGPDTQQVQVSSVSQVARR